MAKGKARAIWTGQLIIGDLEVPMKMYSAAQDQTVHFRLLDKERLKPVHQRIVRKTDGEEVPKDEQRKAVPLGEGHRAVLLTPEDVKELEPKESKDIKLYRFVPRSVLSEQWYEKPYFLGPGTEAKAYWALAKALADEDLIGIARWAMRKKRYIGALTVLDGYLMIVTLRRSDQVLALPDIEPAHEPTEKELTLAERLVSAAAGKFDPGLWQDEYHKRVRKLIAAKASGKVVHFKAPQRREATGDLADQLRQSLSSVKERKAA